jgi:hypothetical protein
MNAEQLSNQFFACLLWNDADQWEALARLYFASGYILNAGYCYRKADVIRDCSFAEAMIPAQVEA